MSNVIVVLFVLTSYVIRAAATACGVACCDAAGAAATAAAASDRIGSLPGFNQPLPSEWYSGYLTYALNEDTTVHTHYMLVQGEEMGEEESDESPLIYWSNGGPGASSLFGLLTELGPLLLDDRSKQTDDFRSTGIPTLQYNPFAWTRLGWILTFDQPAPVGFSYCNNSTNVSSCAHIAWTDELASLNSFLALQAFYEKFPCLRELDLYLTGESYGGIYIPTLARRVLEHNNETRRTNEKAKEPPSQLIPLKGFAVGDGCLGTESGICTDLSDTDAGFGDVFFHAVFLAGHGQIPLSTFHLIMKECYGGHDEEASDLLLMLRGGKPPAPLDNKMGKRSAMCQAALDLAQQQTGGYYGYSLYDDCTYENGLLQRQSRLAASLAKRTRNPAFSSLSLSLTGALNDYACGGGPVMGEWLNLPAVQRALHVDRATFFNVDNADGFNYTPTEKDLRGFYRDLLTGGGKQQVRVLIYNGDTDPSITSFAAQNWTSNLGLLEVQGWRPWTVDHCRRVGGYVTRYLGNFDFLTIRGAGHMVPTYKPAATFAFMKAWIRNEDYPIFDKTCEKPAEKQGKGSVSGGKASSTVAAVAGGGGDQSPSSTASSQAGATVESI